MAWLFDGTNDYVSLANNSAHDFPNGDWAIGGWVKLTSSLSTVNQRLFIRKDSGGDSRFSIFITSDGTNADELRFYWENPGIFQGTSSTSSPFTGNTSWTHVLVQRSGNTITGYINGSSVSSWTNAGIGALDLSDPIDFGRNYDSTQWLNGNMAEWAFWTRALSTTEIDQLYDGGSVSAVALAPSYLSTNLSWYLPMHSGDYTEKIVGITVTNNGTTGATHPVVRYPLTMPLLSNAPTLHSPTLDATYTLVAPLLSATPTLLAPTIVGTVSGQTLVAPLLSVAPTLNSPGLVYTQAITAPYFEVFPTLYAPTLVNAAALGVPLLSVSPSLHAPTLDREVILFVPHLSNAVSLFAPSLSPNLTPPVLSVAPTLYGPTLFAQYTLELPVINVSPSLFSPVVLGPSFPIVQSVTATTTAGVTSHSINMPATVNEGDLLMVLVSNSSSTINSDPAGWAVRRSSTQTPVYLKRAAGTEGGGTITIGTSSSSNMAAQVYRITGWRDSGTLLNDVEMDSVTGSSATPDPSSLNPTNWGLEDTLWVVYAGWNTSDSVSLYPSNYIGGTATSASGARIATAYRKLGASSEDPGTFTLSSSVGWRAHTIAVRPAIAPKFITAPRLELAPTLLPPTLFLDTTQQIVAPLLSLTTTLYPPTLKRIWELVTPNSGTPFSLVTPSSSTDFTLIG